MVLKITWESDQHSADLLLLLTIYPSTSQQDELIQRLLAKSLESRSLVTFRSIRVREHDEADTSIVHTPGFCLSAEAAFSSY